LIDEVRISSVARGPGEMQLFSPAVTISKDPASQNIDYGQPVQFAVSASSLTAMSYQWRHDLTSIPGATNTSFSIPAVAGADAGNYDVVITNTAGYSATSASATLVVGASHFLAHRWSFTNDLSDSIGGATGTGNGNAVVTGGALVLDGTSNTFVSLPAHLLSGLTAVTFDFWASPGTNGANCRIFDFGNTNFVNASVPPPQNYVFFSPHTGGGGHNLGISGGSSEFQQNATGSGTFDSRTVHVTCVVDPPNQKMSVYTNGVLDVVNTNLSVSLASLDDQLCWLGRSLFTADAWLNGSIDEFRIYNGAISPASIQQSQLLGPNNVLDDGPVHIVASPTDTTVVNGRAGSFS
ncbi:MAG TPA: LamG-like jellyroll fold domain-containing protein, partial [Candidatus Binatia bacterium]|nr:LamG-like jellyroll fold domain-containing protein [Candidatus Binatia bacterium]